MYLAYNVAAALGFLVSRRFLRKMIRKHTQHRLIVNALAKAIEKRGWRLVALLQLPPTGVPSPMLNYAVGSVTSLPIEEYMFGTLVGSPFHVFSYVYVGSFLESIEEVFANSEQAENQQVGDIEPMQAVQTSSTSTTEWLMNCTGILLSVGVAVYTARLTQNEIEKIKRSESFKKFEETDNSRNEIKSPSPRRRELVRGNSYTTANGLHGRSSRTIEGIENFDDLSKIV